MKKGTYYAIISACILLFKYDFAVMPVDYDKFCLFAGSLYEKIVETFRYAGRDCPEFQKYMDTFEAKLQDKDFKKALNTKFKDIRRKAFDEGKENRLGHNGTQGLLGDYMLEAYLNSMAVSSKNMKRIVRIKNIKTLFKKLGQRLFSTTKMNR